jgi:hypothetical protein
VIKRGPVSTTKRLVAGLILVILATLPAFSETIQLQQVNGIFKVLVRINDAVAIPFILDSGASEVQIPADDCPRVPCVGGACGLL